MSPLRTPAGVERLQPISRGRASVHVNGPSAPDQNRKKRDMSEVVADEIVEQNLEGVDFKAGQNYGEALPHYYRGAHWEANN